MEDLFKKLFYTGVGVLSITTERLQKNIDELVSKKKLSTEEGRKIVDDVLSKTESKREEFEKQVKKIGEELVNKFDFAKSNELEALKRRVEELEMRLGKIQGTKASAPVAGKKVSKAPVKKDAQANTTKEK